MLVYWRACRLDDVNILPSDIVGNLDIRLPVRKSFDSALPQSHPQTVRYVVRKWLVRIPAKQPKPLRMVNLHLVSTSPERILTRCSKVPVMLRYEI